MFRKFMSTTSQFQFPDDPGMHNTPNMPRGPGDTFTTSSYRQNSSWLQRVQSSCAGILIGIAIIVGACCLQFWNEGRAVQTAQSLDEGLRSVISLRSTEVAFQENTNKLVHLTGPLRTDKVLNDEQYGVAVNAVKLKRNVEMYQWVETEHKREYQEGDGVRTETTYSYSTEWRSDVVRSTSFHNPTNHHNPNSMLVQPQIAIAENVQVGNFYLSQNLINRISSYKKLTPTKVPASLPNVQLAMGVFYHGKNPQQPEVGDLKVSFEYSGLSGKENAPLGSPERVSIIARQAGNQLTKYQTDAGDELEILYPGELTAKQIFDQEHAANSMLTWGIRFGSWFLMWIGFGCLTSLLTTLVDWIPLVRTLVGIGVSLLNLSLSISLSLTVIALGWIRYRPLLGFTILICASIPFLLSYKKGRQQRKNERAV